MRAAKVQVWGCAVKICHDGMLEDTNSLDGAQLIMIEWGTVRKPHYVFYFRNALSSIGKIFIIDLFQNFIFFSEGSCEYVKYDHVLLNVLLNISTVTGNWLRKFVFNFNLTGV